MSRLTNTAKGLSPKESRTDSLTTPPSLPISEHSLIQDVQSFTEELRISVPQDSHVNHFLSQVKAKRSRMIEICGPKQSVLFPSLSHDLSFSKMFPVFCPTSMPSQYSEKSVKTATRLYPRLNLGLMTLEVITEGKGCGFWPTIQATEARQGLQIRRKGRKEIQESLTTAVKTWPTPAQRDYRNQHADNSEAFEKRKENPRGVNLVEKMQRRNQKGQLNPDWVEWLMNFPIGWTSLEPLKELVWLSQDVDPADLEKSQEWRSPAQQEPGIMSGRLRPINGGKLGGMNRHFDKETGRMAQIGLTQQTQIRKQGCGPIPRVATGIKDRVNRLKAIGNGQYPECFATAWKILSGRVGD